jgi:hypothetical protein
MRNTIRKLLICAHATLRMTSNKAPLIRNPPMRRSETNFAISRETSETEFGQLDHTVAMVIDKRGRCHHEVLVVVHHHPSV